MLVQHFDILGAFWVKLGLRLNVGVKLREQCWCNFVTIRKLVSILHDDLANAQCGHNLDGAVYVP